MLNMLYYIVLIIGRNRRGTCLRTIMQFHVVALQCIVFSDTQLLYQNDSRSITYAIDCNFVKFVVKYTMKEML